MKKFKNRISPQEAIELFNEKDLLKLGRLATNAKERFHTNNSPITFVVDRNINYTNICACKCKFCAFYKLQNGENAYVLDYQQVKEKIDELVVQNGTQILLQGGLNPDLSFEYYTDLISNIRKDFPELTIHAFSPPEIMFMAKKQNASIKEILQELIRAGLSSIPGGGAEILSDNIRKKISPNKITSDEWLSVMKEAHYLGLKTTATMVFGFGEDYKDIIEHLSRIRDLQDETGGFTAFIPWSFQPDNTELSASNIRKTTPYDYLRVLAISRIFLDNIKNIQASWVTQGIKVAQTSLCFGTNDFGGTMLEENVVRAAGTINRTNKDEIVQAIKNAGYVAAQRNTAYEIIKTYN